MKPGIALFLLVLGLVILVPVVVVMIGAIRYKRNVADASGWIILVAAALLSVQALAILEPLVLAMLQMEPEEIAGVSMFMAYTRPAVTYFAVLLLGIGLWIRSGKMRSGRQQGSGE